tara:strand:- start:257 stop:535 length:279 start_codon:yes stop_codon:yes gene_type:complete
MRWSPAKSDYELPWIDLKLLGLTAIDQGAKELNLSTWDQASSAHLAVILVWWNYSIKKTNGVKVTGLNETFKTLAKLGGVAFLFAETEDVGH